MESESSPNPSPSSPAADWAQIQALLHCASITYNLLSSRLLDALCQTSKGELGILLGRERE